MTHLGTIKLVGLCVVVVLEMATLSPLQATDVPLGTKESQSPDNTKREALLKEGDAASGEASAEEPADRGKTDPWKKPELMVGDSAPAVDIEYWLQDGEGKLKHVTEFEPGKVYVVEFWATGCPGCVATLPHLGELQERYAEKGVQIISVSDERVEHIKAFLELSAPDSGKKTFAEVTASYCLTADPDRSVHKSYMDAALRNGVPSAFIVGKKGKIEWIGYATEPAMDAALEKVVDDSWDRDAFKATFDVEQQLEAAKMQVLVTAQSNLEEAEAMIKELVATAPSESLKKAAEGLQAEIGILAFREYVDSDQVKAAAMFPQLAAQGKGQPFFLANLVVRIERRIAEGEEVIPELYEPALKAVDDALPAAEGFEKEVYRCLRVRLLQAKGELDQAIKEEEALLSEATAEEKKKEYQGVLDQLKELKKKGE